MPTKKKVGPKTKKPGARSKPAFGAKARFVESLPLDMPAKQVMEEAKKKNFSVTENHIYSVRAAMRKKATVSAKAAARGPRKASPKERRPPKVTNAASGVEAQLRKAIAELGLTRARAVFAEVEAAFAGQ